MNLLVKFISHHTDYFGQNLVTAHLPQEHDAGYSLKQDDQSVEEKQYKLLKKKTTKTKQPEQNSSNTSTQRSQKDQALIHRLGTEVLRDKRAPCQRTAKLLKV